jgi:hypothetical protein
MAPTGSRGWKGTLFVKNYLNKKWSRPNIYTFLHHITTLAPVLELFHIYMHIAKTGRNQQSTNM